MLKTKLRICYSLKINLDFILKIINGGTLAGGFCCKEGFCSREFVLIPHPQKIYHDFNNSLKRHSMKQVVLLYIKLELELPKGYKIGQLWLSGDQQKRIQLIQTLPNSFEGASGPIYGKIDQLTCGTRIQMIILTLIPLDRLKKIWQTARQ